MLLFYNSVRDFHLTAWPQTLQSNNNFWPFLNHPSRESKDSKTAQVKRNLKREWFKEFPRLRYDSNRNILFCDYCNDAGRENVFTKAKSAFFPKNNDIVQHQTSKDHKFAVTAHNSKDAEEMPKAMSTMYSDIKVAIVAVMKNFYSTAKEELPKEKVKALNEQCRIQVFIFYSYICFILYYSLDNVTDISMKDMNDIYKQHILIQNKCLSQIYMFGNYRTLHVFSFKMKYPYIK